MKLIIVLLVVSIINNGRISCDLNFQVTNVINNKFPNNVLYYFFNISLLANAYADAVNTVVGFLPQKIDVYNDFSMYPPSLSWKTVECYLALDKGGWDCPVPKKLVFKLSECTLQTQSTFYAGCLWSASKAPIKGCTAALLPQCYGSRGSFTVNLTKEQYEACPVNVPVTVCSKPLIGTYWTDPTIYSMLRNNFVNKMIAVVETASFKEWYQRSNFDFGKAVVGALCSPCAWGIWGGGGEIAEIKDAMKGIQTEIKQLEANTIKSINAVQGQINLMQTQMNNALNQISADAMLAYTMIWRCMDYIDQMNQVNFRLIDLETLFMKLSNSMGGGLNSLDQIMNISNIKLDVLKYVDKVEMDKFVSKPTKDGFVLMYPISNDSRTLMMSQTEILCDEKFCKLYDEIQVTNNGIIVDDIMYAVKHNPIDSTMVLDDNILRFLPYKLIPSNTSFYRENSGSLIYRCPNSTAEIRCSNRTTLIEADILFLSYYRCEAVRVKCEDFQLERFNKRIEININLANGTNFTFQKEDQFYINVTTFIPSTIDFKPVDDMIDAINSRIDGMSWKFILLYIVLGIVGIIIIIMIIKCLLSK